jgi:hypothetical protein
MGESQVSTSRSPRAAAALLVSLIAVAALPVAASAQPAPGQQSAESPFFANLTFPFFGSFNAVSEAGGSNPSGQVNYFMGAGPTSGKNVSATVVCLSVSGNTAVIGFQGTSVRGLEPPVPVVGELVVADNGPADSLLDTVGLAERATGAANCAAPGPVSPKPVSGDVIVHPPALPTSKEQCKKGGWRNFGTVFKNQGDCVSFVATGS